jgi:hypothetical protein
VVLVQVEDVFDKFMNIEVSESFSQEAVYVEGRVHLANLVLNKFKDMSVNIKALHNEPKENC